MKHRRRVGLAATTLTAGAIISGFGAAAAAGGGQGDLASGSALNQFPTPLGPGFSELTVSAQSDPSGVKPRGNVQATGTTGMPNGDFDVAGPVTCLRVEGNRAAIKYRFSQAKGSAALFKGGGVEVFVEDNGQSSGGQPDANASRQPQPAGVFDTNATQCDDPNDPTVNYDTVTSGDYAVRDVIGP